MIRNVVLGRMNEPGNAEARERMQAALEAVAALDPPGQLAVKVGLDLGLREQAWDFAITSDFVDEASYQAYDGEAEHNRIRKEQFAPLCAQIVRVQFEA